MLTGKLEGLTRKIDDPERTGQTLMRFQLRALLRKQIGRIPRPHVAADAAIVSVELMPVDFAVIRISPEKVDAIPLQPVGSGAFVG